MQGVPAVECPGRTRNAPERRTADGCGLAMAATSGVGADLGHKVRHGVNDAGWLGETGGRVVKVDHSERGRWAGQRERGQHPLLRLDHFVMSIGGVMNGFKHAASMIANEDQGAPYSLIGRTWTALMSS